MRMRVPAIQSHIRYPLTRLFGGGGNIRVLRALVFRGGPLSVAQLARDSGLTPQGVRLVLESLIGQHWVLALGEPRAQLFAIQRGHPLIGELDQLFAAEKARWDEILGSLRSTLEATVEAAWYYGSVARGNDDPASDFDVAVVIRGDDVERAVESIRDALQPLEERLVFNLVFNCSIVGLSEANVKNRSKHCSERD